MDVMTQRLDKMDGMTHRVDKMDGVTHSLQIQRYNIQQKK